MLNFHIEPAFQIICKAFYAEINYRSMTVKSLQTKLIFSEGLVRMSFGQPGLPVDNSAVIETKYIKLNRRNPTVAKLNFQNCLLLKKCFSLQERSSLFHQFFKQLKNYWASF